MGIAFKANKIDLKEQFAVDSELKNPVQPPASAAKQVSFNAVLGGSLAYAWHLQLIGS